MSVQAQKLVSIVLATYNGEKFLSEQLDSVFNQTYQNIEVVVVDDCSTDDTISILNAYQARYANMKVYGNDTNLGYIKNFEKGCTIAKGEFIALCDQDDYWAADKITGMVNAIEDYPMVYCNSLLCDHNLESTGVYISDRAVLKSIDNCLQQAVFCRIYGHATLFTKDFFQKAYPFLPVIPHDWWLSYVATLHGGIKYLNEPLVHYRQHASNIFGAVGGKSRKKQNAETRLQKKHAEIARIRARIKAFADICPEHLSREKKILNALAKSYESFSLTNNFLRVAIFLRYYKLLLAVKKRSALRKFLFCLKMFFIIK